MKTVALYRPNFMDEFDHYMESFFGDMPVKSMASLLRRGIDFPAVDLRETDGAYLLDAELPGYDEKNINIHVDGNRLTIESKQAETETTEKDEGSYIIRERRQHSFSRVFQLPDNADSNAISAVFKNGILSLEIKKQTESQKRVIQINS
ncbi:MAG: Hsp20/alpha crystallin family protein [Treponema sp.]|jgi:HSP20 family protein|nr:Hsp20/alpha crystallin family protein [Treponema sp.]